jgi:hypothetical protein
MRHHAGKSELGQKPMRAHDLSLLVDQCWSTPFEGRHLVLALLFDTAPNAIVAPIHPKTKRSAARSSERSVKDCKHLSRKTRAHTAREKMNEILEECRVVMGLS